MLLDVGIHAMTGVATYLDGDPEFPSLSIFLGHAGCSMVLMCMPIVLGDGISGLAIDHRRDVNKITCNRISWNNYYGIVAMTFI